MQTTVQRAVLFYCARRMREPDPAYAAGGARAPSPLERGGRAPVGHGGHLEARRRRARGQLGLDVVRKRSGRVGRRSAFAVPIADADAVLLLAAPGLTCVLPVTGPVWPCPVPVSAPALHVAHSCHRIGHKPEPEPDPESAPAIADATAACTGARAGRLAAQRAGAPPHDAHRHRSRARPRRMQMLPDPLHSFTYSSNH